MVYRYSKKHGWLGVCDKCEKPFLPKFACLKKSNMRHDYNWQLGRHWKGRKVVSCKVPCNTKELFDRNYRCVFSGMCCGCNPFHIEKEFLYFDGGLVGHALFKLIVIEIDGAWVG